MGSLANRGPLNRPKQTPETMTEEPETPTGGEATTPALGVGLQRRVMLLWVRLTVTEVTGVCSSPCHYLETIIGADVEIFVDGAPDRRSKVEIDTLRG